MQTEFGTLKLSAGGERWLKFSSLPDQPVTLAGRSLDIMGQYSLLGEPEEGRGILGTVQLFWPGSSDVLPFDALTYAEQTEIRESLATALGDHLTAHPEEWTDLYREWVRERNAKIQGRIGRLRMEIGVLKSTILPLP